MTNKELEKKAFEYRKELVPYTELGYSDAAIPVYDSIDIDRAFVAGAALMQEEVEKLKDLLNKSNAIENFENPISHRGCENYSQWELAE